MTEEVSDFSTLVDLLRYRALHQPEQTALYFLLDGESEQVRLTYSDLDSQARAIAAELQSLNATGDRALLLYPPGLDFIAAFFGCLYAGVVAVPVYPPPRPNRSDSRLQTIVADAQARFLLTTTTLLPNIQKRLANSPDLKSKVTKLDAGTPPLRLCTDSTAASKADEWVHPTLHSNNIAFLQYTSGSTATPKGVIVSHANLLHNSSLIYKNFQHSPNSRGVIWLPPYHDMGLIGGIIQPIYGGFPVTLMSPVTFLQRPYRWLMAISRDRATTSGAPNFAYDLCVRKIPDAQIASLDLSTWSVAFTGAEPIRRETLDLFAARFQQCGFRREAFYPCYGLAEATLFVSGGRITNDFEDSEQKTFDKRYSTVSCGQVLDTQNVIIVNTESLIPCPDGQVGEIWVDSPSVAKGYWNRPDQTEQTFRAQPGVVGVGSPRPEQGSRGAGEQGSTGAGEDFSAASTHFLRTGDLGFLQGGELFVTGRIKDLIIIRGRNHYPQDIELTVEKSHPALRSHASSAFAVEVDGSEQVVIVQEVERSYLRNNDLGEAILAIRSAVAEHHELQVYAVLLLKTGSIPKTSSGKIQRYACRAGFLANTLDVVKGEVSNVNRDSGRNVNVGTNSLMRVENQGVSEEAENPFHTSQFTNEPSKRRADELIDWLRSYATDRINSQLIDERRCIPPHIVLSLGNRGILGMQIPETYGGLGLSTTDAGRVIEQLAAIDLTLATFVSLNNTLGIRPIQYYATQQVRDEFLPILARGRELAAFAITEPGAGSNPRAISSMAVPDGMGGWRLHGEKVWIGSGSWAGVINVFVKEGDAGVRSPHSRDRDGASAKVNQQKSPTTYIGSSLPITGYVVRQGTAGLRHGPEALTMGMRGMVQNTIYLDDVPVQPVDLLGEPGTGFDVASDAMMFARLGIAAICVGGMKRIAQLMLRYATRRSVASGRLLDNPVTLTRLSDLTAAIAAVSALVSAIAQGGGTPPLHRGDGVPEEAFIACKTSSPEFLWQAADSLVQLLGGRGYIESNIAPQILRDARLLRIFEGPTETLNMFLGSRVINEGAELDKFLRERLGALAIADRLRDGADQIKARCLGRDFTFLGAPFWDRSSALRWTYSLTGEVATYAILWAAVQASPVMTDQLRRADVWARLRFEQTLAKALSPTPAESVLLQAREMMDLVSSYGEAIGDLEQTLAGEDNALDPLLKKGAGELRSGGASERGSFGASPLLLLHLCPPAPQHHYSMNPPYPRVKIQLQPG